MTIRGMETFDAVASTSKKWMVDVYRIVMFIKDSYSIEFREINFFLQTISILIYSRFHTLSNHYPIIPLLPCAEFGIRSIYNVTFEQ